MKILLLIALVFLSPCLSIAQRSVESLNSGWTFHFAHDVQKQPAKTPVSLPHTWNANEVTTGKPYNRTAGNYEKKWLVSKDLQDKRLFLRFEGVNSMAHVFINNRLVGSHEGGYTAFCLEVTDFVKIGSENLLTVLASNAYNLGVLPLSGDFNVYGGVHRPVSLIVTADNCITPLDYASAGVYVKQKNISAGLAQLEVLTKLSVRSKERLSLKTQILNAEGIVVAEGLSNVRGNEVRQELQVKSPQLWNGKADPYLYQVKSQLLASGRVIDEISQSVGFRYFHVDAEKGFFLNGKYLDLRGLCRHEDVSGKGSALSNKDHELDMELIKEIGATSLRLTHYPHSSYFYDLCDRNGIVLWSEIPLVGPGGYSWAGYVNNPALHSHAKQVLTELIRQNYNHPSICFWGLFNEIKLDFDDPVPLITELGKLAKAEDPFRLTTCATFLDSDHYNEVSDLIAWNKYFGWYGGSPNEMGEWADNVHSQLPLKPIGISEYGAGASIFHHEEEMKAPNPSGRWHPEGWQAFYHEENWRELSTRPFVWGKYIWVMADFGSTIRSEGDTLGMNDKGIITYDRKTKKDAFFFYKANWNNEPMVYLADRRHSVRKNKITTIKCYSNLPEVELFVNEISVGTSKPDEVKIARWKNVELKSGKNRIEVKAKNGDKVLGDGCEWVVD